MSELVRLVFNNIKNLLKEYSALNVENDSNRMVAILLMTEDVRENHSNLPISYSRLW